MLARGHVYSPEAGEGMYGLRVDLSRSRVSGVWGRPEAGSTLRGLIWGHDGVLDFILLGQCWFRDTQLLGCILSPRMLGIELCPLPKFIC